MRSIWTFIGIAILNSIASGQVATLGVDPGNSRAALASCDGGGCGGGCGDCGWTSSTVWGTTCLDSCPTPCGVRHGLFAPCPNPCQSSFICDVLRDLRCAVGTGVSNVLTCIFPCSPCGCGVAMCDGGCGSGVVDGSMDMDCSCDGCSANPMAAPMMAPAAEAAPFQPMPQPAVTAPADPFKDDPQAVRMRAPRRVTATLSRRVAQTAYQQTADRAAVRSASANVRHLTKPRTTISAPQNVMRHYHHRPGTALRGANFSGTQRARANGEI